MKVSDHVSKTGTVSFQRYHDQNLWYKTDDTNFEFPVPIEDIGNATFLATDKSILFMRYIRKHIDLLQSNEECAR